MENEVVKFEDVGSLLKDRVRQVIATSIPDEQIEKLVKDQIGQYFNKPAKRNHYDPEPTSPFEVLLKNIVSSHIEKIAKELILQSINKKLCDDTYLEKMIVEITPSVMQSVFASMISFSINNLKNNIHQQY